jgi:hypothetical protein
LKSCLAAGLVGFGQGRAPAQETHHGSSFLRCTRNILLVRWVNRGESWWIVVNHFISKISALFDILTHILILYAFVKTLSLNSWDIGDIGHHDDTPRYCTVRYPTSSNSLNTRLPHVVPASGLASCPIRWLACHAEIQRKRVAALRCMDLYSQRRAKDLQEMFIDIDIVWYFHLNKIEQDIARLPLPLLVPRNTLWIPITHVTTNYDSSNKGLVCGKKPLLSVACCNAPVTLEIESPTATLVPIEKCQTFAYRDSTPVNSEATKHPWLTKSYCRDPHV